MSYSGGAIFGGSDFVDGGEDDNNIFGGAFSSLAHLSKDGKIITNSWLSVALSVVTLIILLVLLLPIFLPEQWKSIKSQNNILGQYATWSEKQEVKFMYLVLGAYFIWTEWNFKN
jgi:hypothetical protein